MSDNEAAGPASQVEPIENEGNCFKTPANLIRPPFLPLFTDGSYVINSNKLFPYSRNRFGLKPASTTA